MKIDRHNYEEFFLLYVDNELTREQRKAVDEFVQQNPDLAMELEILQQTTLAADESVVFDNKELLLKKQTGSAIDLSNYEEYLISYLDNELTDADRIAFFNFVQQHPQVKEELAIYQQTKLQPDADIVFAGKQVLYRKEEKVRVITLQWWKIAAAAAVLLAAGITTIKVISNNSKQVVHPSVAAANKENTEKKSSTEKTAEAIKNEQSKPVDEKSKDNNTGNIAAATGKDKKGNTDAVPAVKDHERKTKSVAPGSKPSNETLAVNDKHTLNNNEISPGNVGTAKTIDALKKLDEPVKTNDVAMTTSLPKENINTNPVTPATDEPLDNKETAQNFTNDNAVYASYDEGKNKKLRGFFRKASRVFERRTNISAADEEEKQDKVLIGALAVKLK